MPLAEIPHRVIEFLHRRTSAFSWRIRRDSQLPDEVLQRILPSLPLNLARLPSMMRNTELPALGKEVNGLCAGNIRLLGQDWPAGHILDWSVDPESGNHWPWNRYAFDIPRRHGQGPGDVKFPWELSRLQYLQTLAFSAHTMNRIDARERCLKYLECWLDDNPSYDGLGYACGIELASRVVSVLVVITYLGPETVSNDLRERLWRLLATHGRFIARFPSLYSSANNHLVAESAALFILGEVAPGIPESSRWREMGWRRLLREAPRQVLNDGAGAEQSPTYLAYTLEWLLLARQVFAAHSNDDRTQLDDTIRRGAIFISSIADRKGNVPFFGDCDDGVVLRPRIEERNYLSSIVCAIASCVGDATLMHPAFKPDLRSLMLTKTLVKSGTCDLAATTFEYGGYSVIRRNRNDSEIFLLFDHGPLGFAQTAAHGHADALSIWLHVNGEPIVVDFGTYRYNADLGFRQWARGTAAHNTIEVDGISQSEMTGPFNWGRRADARLLDSFRDENKVGFRGCHSGYAEKLGVTHERTVAVTTSGNVEIIDALQGSGEHNICLSFHFAPGLEIIVVDHDASFHMHKNGDTIGTFNVVHQGMKAEVIRQEGEFRPGPGVSSECYNHLAACFAIVCVGKLALPCEIRSNFQIL